MDKGDDPQPDSKMGDGQVEIATGPRSANSTRPGAPMFREQPYNSQQQGALFPVHTIVVSQREITFVASEGPEVLPLLRLSHPHQTSPHRRWTD